MGEIGLINPVTVNKDMTLIVGAHRIEAARLLGWTEIEVFVVDLDELRAELFEIDENLMRNDLHYIDRGNSIRRREELLKKIGMRAKVGDNQHTAGPADSAAPMTTNNIAASLGISGRTLREERQISTSILPEVQQAIKDADLPKRDALKIARMEPEEQLRVAEKLDNGAKSLIDARRLVKRDDVHGTPELDGKYRVIYADPPWAYGDKLTEGYGPAENHYPTMTLAEICDLPIKDIAEDNAVLFLWVTSPMLEDSFEVIRAWGFDYKTSFVWDKIKHNMGHYNSVRHELLLVCTKGSCLPDSKKLYDSVVSEERTEHSKKPELFRAIIDDLYPHGGRVELFARSTAPGWETWGNQT
jgi:N6-adenosine-specific RNA methylase IME4